MLAGCLIFFAGFLSDPSQERDFDSHTCAQDLDAACISLSELQGILYSILFQLEHVIAPSMY